MFNWISSLFSPKKFRIFKLGSDEYPVSRKQLETFTEALRKKGFKDKEFIVWDHTLEEFDI